MTDRIILSVQGGPALQQALEAIDDAARKEGLAHAAQAGGAEILAGVHVPVGPGRYGKHLAAGLKLKPLMSSDERAMVGVGIFGRTVAHLVEFGHFLVRGGKRGHGGHFTGHVAAHPFLRPAFDLEAQPAADATGEDLRHSIEAAVP